MSTEQRATIRACAVAMQNAADLLDSLEQQELAWRLKTAAVAIYQLYPQQVGGESVGFDAALRKRIDEAIPVAGISGVFATVHGERYLSDDEAAPTSLLNSGVSWGEDLNRSHL
jgi:hypothetical protein